jgi:hypothetical protein
MDIIGSKNVWIIIVATFAYHLNSIIPIKKGQPLTTSEKIPNEGYSKKAYVD